MGLPKEEFYVSGARNCAGCGFPTIIRIVTKAAGKNTIIVNATGCMEVVSTPYPQTAWKLPWVHAAFENAAAVASGVEAALKKLKKDANVIVFGGDGGTYDIGFQALSGMMERGHNVLYICYDNEAYENTGIQRSSSTPKFSWTTTTPIGKKIRGKRRWKKPITEIMAAHGSPFVATASPHLHMDLFNKVKKALSIKGPKFMKVLSPCVIGWKIPSNKTIEVEELAVESGVFPIYEIVNGKLTINYKPKKLRPVKEYLMMQGRFKHLNEKEIRSIQERVNKYWDYLLNLEKLDNAFFV